MHKVCVVTLISLASCSITGVVGADPGPAEPETRTLPALEASKLLEEDWLFQAEGKPLDRCR